jgi:hypothetical protein
MIQFFLGKIEPLVVRILRKFSNINGSHYFVFLGLFSVIPLLFLSYFNNPGSDDFDYEFKRPFSQIIQTQIELYHGWSGRYFSIPFMSINPDIYITYCFYKYYPIVIILLFLLSLFWFFKIIFSNENNLKIASFVGFFVFLFCLQLPDMCQTFFWYSSSICYQFGNVLFVLFLTSFIAYKKSKRILYLFFALLTVVAAIGSNEMLMLLILFSSIWFLISKNYYAKKIDFSEIILFAVIVFFSILVVVAPGNTVRLVREGVVNNHNLISSLVKSAFYLVSYFIDWFPMIVLAAFVFSDSLSAISKNCKDKSVLIHPMVSLVGMITLFFPCFFVGFWTHNSILPVRALNAIYFFFLLFALYFLFCVQHFLKSKFNFEFQLSKTTKVVLGIILIGFVFSNTPISQAYFDFFSGKAYRYNNEMENRFELIRKSEKKECELPALINLPLTIYSRDVIGLTNDKNNWKNIEIARYFRKKSIVIQPNDSIVTE